MECAPGDIVLDVGGVGYRLQIPISTYYTLAAVEAAEVRLHVHTHVREDAIQLFGFATREERTAFEQLLTIAGVGPRVALAVLSGIGVDELCAAVRQQDRVRLRTIPGVGPKTAERVLLELRDKLDRLLPPPTASGGGNGQPATGPTNASAGDDALSALVNLGYAREVARAAVSAALEREGVGATLEQVLRNALARLVR
jgi:Holliday junction DNA helicase RuvA